DSDCVSFLQWALPRMQLAWPGFRKVRRTVCKRIEHRCRALGMVGVHGRDGRADLAKYRRYLERTPGEWEALRVLCSIPISRFYRDRAIFGFLAREVVPALAAGVERRSMGV